jgi:hypothetical protein
MKNRYTKIKIITVVLALLFIRLTVNGCSVCFSNSEVFIDNLEKSPLVIHAKVIQQLKKQNSIFNGVYFDGITQLKVLHSFKGKLWTDTLIHINLPSLECGNSLEGLEINQEVILKAYLSNDLSWAAKTENRKYSDINSKTDSLIMNLAEGYQNIETGYCDINILTINKGRAEGLIRYKSNRKWNKYKKIKSLDEQKALEFFEKQINFESFIKTLSRKKMFATIRKRIKGER